MKSSENYNKKENYNNKNNRDKIYFFIKDYLLSSIQGFIILKIFNLIYYIVENIFVCTSLILMEKYKIVANKTHSFIIYSAIQSLSIYLTIKIYKTVKIHKKNIMKKLKIN